MKLTSHLRSCWLLLWAATAMFEATNVLAQPFQERFGYALVTDGTCESNGYKPITFQLDDEHGPLQCHLATMMLSNENYIQNFRPQAWTQGATVADDGVRGCSVDFKTPGTWNDQNDIRTLFFNPSGACLADSCGCTASRPCICREKRDPSPLCVDGKFTPETDKYYTIVGENTRVLVSQIFGFGDDKNKLQLEAPQQAKTCDVKFGFCDNKNPDAHFRFLPTESTNIFEVINRFTLLGWEKGTGSRNAIMISGTDLVNVSAACDDNGKILFVFAGTKNIVRGGFKLNFGTLDHLWTIEEVQEFNRLGPELGDEPLVVGGETSAKSISTAMAKSDTSFLLGEPTNVVFDMTCSLCGGFTKLAYSFGGALAGAVGVPKLFPTDSLPSRKVMEDTIQKLTDDLLKISGETISAELAGEELFTTQNEAVAQRLFFLFQYPLLKQGLIKENATASLQQLAVDLEAAVLEYRDHIRTLFGTSSATGNDAVQRGRIGFDFRKLAIMEVMSMLQEALLLETYTSGEDLNCGELLTKYQLEATARVYQEELQDLFSLILEDRRDNTCCNIELNDGTIDLFDDGELIFRSNDPQDVSETLERYRVAITHDITHLSFSVIDELAYLSQVVDQTLEMCEALVTDDVFRRQFETDLLQRELWSGGPSALPPTESQDSADGPGLASCAQQCAQHFVDLCAHQSASSGADIAGAITDISGFDACSQQCTGHFGPVCAPIPTTEPPSPAPSTASPSGAPSVFDLITRSPTESPTVALSTASPSNAPSVFDLITRSPTSAPGAPSTASPTGPPSVFGSTTESPTSALSTASPSGAPSAVDSTTGSPTSVPTIAFKEHIPDTPKIGDQVMIKYIKTGRFLRVRGASQLSVRRKGFRDLSYSWIIEEGLNGDTHSISLRNEFSDDYLSIPGQGGGACFASQITEGASGSPGAATFEMKYIPAKGSFILANEDASGSCCVVTNSKAFFGAILFRRGSCSNVGALIELVPFSSGKSLRG